MSKDLKTALVNQILAKANCDTTRLHAELSAMSINALTYILEDAEKYKIAYA
jgi:hypothetical protein